MQGSVNVRGSLVHVADNQEVEILGGKQGGLSIKGLFLVTSSSIQDLYSPI